MSEFLRRYANFVGNGSYQGKLYQVAYYPGVVPSDNPQNRVQGEVYQLIDADKLFAQLDEYEECSSHFPQRLNIFAASKTSHSQPVKLSRFGFICLIAQPQAYNSLNLETFINTNLFFLTSKNLN